MKSCRVNDCICHPGYHKVSFITWEIVWPSEMRGVFQNQVLKLWDKERELLSTGESPGMTVFYKHHQIILMGQPGLKTSDLRQSQQFHSFCQVIDIVIGACDINMVNKPWGQISWGYAGKAFLPFRKRTQREIVFHHWVALSLWNIDQTSPVWL